MENLHTELWRKLQNKIEDHRWYEKKVTNQVLYNIDLDLKLRTSSILNVCTQARNEIQAKKGLI